MTDDTLKDLVEITDAMYQAELGEMRILTARESDLRKNLANLEKHRRSNLSLPNDQLTNVRQIGADVLWQGWISRTRYELNIELAQTLAQKSRILQSLRQAFGKQMAARDLLISAHARCSQEKIERDQAEQDALGRLKLHQKAKAFLF